MSHMMATASFLKRQSTTRRELIRSGPVSNVSFSETPQNFAEQSKTTLSFSGFLGWNTPWYGMYHESSVLSQERLALRRLSLLYPSWRLCTVLYTARYFSIFSLGAAVERLEASCCLVAEVALCSWKEGAFHSVHLSFELCCHSGAEWSERGLVTHTCLYLLWDACNGKINYNIVLC